jgi:hypothetical protein
LERRMRVRCKRAGVDAVITMRMCEEGEGEREGEEGWEERRDQRWKWRWAWSVARGAMIECCLRRRVEDEYEPEHDEESLPES